MPLKAAIVSAVLGLLVSHAAAFAEQKPASSTDTPECIAAIEPAIEQLVRREYDASVPVVKEWAGKGCAQAQLFLGLMYVEADGVPRDCARGVELVQDLADRFYNDAQVFLGRLFEHGRCTGRNPQEAYKWYAIAAAHPTESDTRTKARELRRVKQVVMLEGEAEAGDAAALAWWRKHYKP